jgi:predicted transcriptional regulator
MNTKERKPGLHTENRSIVHRIPRKKADIIVEILKYISSYGHVGGLQITSLMYLCYVEHSRLKKFLVNLTDKKLVEYYKNSRRYKITQNGTNFLEKYKTIRGSPKMLDSLQQNNGS